MQSLRNLAIVAHVDHGKTTLVDGLLRQSLEMDLQQERVMDSGDIEKERGITIRAKNCCLYWKNHKINLLDTPGHADFGGEVERSLSMVDGIILLVDAAEGPLPQTRFVLQKALERNLKMAVVINKIDRPDARIKEVIFEIENLILELMSYLEKDDLDLDFPVLFASAKNGYALKNLEDPKENFHCLLDLFLEYFPEPQKNSSLGETPTLLISNVSHSPYLGQLGIGKIFSGTFQKNSSYRIYKKDSQENFKITSLQVFDGLGIKTLDQASQGEIVIIAGASDMSIGDTISSQEEGKILPRLEIDPPTVSVEVSVSTSPLSGKEGSYLTSRKLDEFLADECLHNVAIEYAPTEDPKVFMLKARGELQLAIIFEELRRKGYEFMVGRPQVILKENEEGVVVGPYERLFLDVPSEFVGAMTEILSKRKGKMEAMTPFGSERTRLEFIIPSESLIGFRGLFLTETKGQGIMSSLYWNHQPYTKASYSRNNGAIICDRAGKATPYALYNLLSSGVQFISPGAEVYEGMVIGEHSRSNDINVNPTKEKHLSGVRTAGKDENIILPPPRQVTLEYALDWIDNDEWIEITPKSIRVRKKNLAANQRSVIRR